MVTDGGILFFDPNAPIRCQAQALSFLTLANNVMLARVRNLCYSARVIFGIPVEVRFVLFFFKKKAQFAPVSNVAHWGGFLPAVEMTKKRNFYPCRVSIRILRKTEPHPIPIIFLRSCPIQTILKERVSNSQSLLSGVPVI
ncbi:MAG TPA: hypothetical protein PK299_08730 [Anaerolineales bacterium]|nr:hypothetical protein [Anaerolineales bacterium]